MNKVFLRKKYILVEEGSEYGPVFNERLDINVDQESGSNQFRHCSFSFRSQISGVANIEGHVGFNSEYEPTNLSHSSGRITDETMSNFNAFNSLLSRLETLCGSGLTDEQIFADKRVQLILKNNDFKLLDMLSERKI